MISDAELQHYAEKDRDVWPDSALAEMAKELLQCRQADRAIWENAPEWANWYAIDDDGCITWFENRPSHNDSFWYPDGGRYGTDSLDGWQSTLQERPK